MKKIVLSEFGDALMHNLPDDRELVGHVGVHNKCGGEICAIPIHTYKAIKCYKCGWGTPALLGVGTIGKLLENFRCYNGNKESL